MFFSPEEGEKGCLEELVARVNTVIQSRRWKQF